jgi:hypothetical protein
MKRKFLLQNLNNADRAGVWAFTPETFSAQFGDIEPGYRALMMKRLAEQGVLTRAARGVYVNASARCLPADVRGGLIRFLRPREISYVSLESRLSESGVISQVTTVMTCMTTGSRGRFDTPFGAIEFTHTGRDIEFGADVRVRDDGVLEASIARAARDLRRVGRNVGLIDETVLAEAIREEGNHERAR